MQLPYAISRNKLFLYFSKPFKNYLCMFALQIDISSWGWTDGRTDGGTDGRTDDRTEGMDRPTVPLAGDPAAYSHRSLTSSLHRIFFNGFPLLADPRGGGLREIGWRVDGRVDRASWKSRIPAKHLTLGCKGSRGHAVLV